MTVPRVICQHFSGQKIKWPFGFARRSMGPGNHWPNGGAGGYTSEQTNAHSTDIRELCYPWHPWYQCRLVIRITRIRRDRQVFHCRPEPDDGTKALEVPQWMFDPHVCNKMRLSAAPIASCSALQQLQALLHSVTENNHCAVVQTPPCSSTSGGEADATATHTPSQRATRSVPSTPVAAGVGDAASDRQRRDDPVSGTTIEQCSASKRRGGTR